MFYGSATGFITYQEDRGKTLSQSWTIDKTESALLVASEWLDNIYGRHFIGYKTNGFEQQREWPRTSAQINPYIYYHSFTYDPLEIPDRIEQATYEAAFRELTTQGSLQKDYTPQPYRSVSIDGAVRVEYNLSISQAGDSQVQIPIIQSLMLPLMDYENSGIFSNITGKSERV